MFVRAKKSGAYQYLQLVRNERINGQVRQQVVANRGMISKKTIEELQAGHRDVRFILGARLRRQKKPAIELEGGS
ncbi:MAG: hypothetical protein ACUVXJ_01275 [Phycisphaerae bacterium]